MTVTVCLHIFSMVRTQLFNTESSGLTVASLKTFNNPTVCKVLNFQRQIQKAALSERQAGFVERRNERTEKTQSHSLLSGQGAPERRECTGNHSYKGCACPTERGLVPSGHISQVMSAPAEQEIKKLETAELLI